MTDISHEIRPSVLVWGMCFLASAYASGVVGWSVLTVGQGALLGRLSFLLFSGLALITLMSQIVHSPTG